MKDVGEIQVTVGEVVNHIRASGAFAPALREVVCRKLTRDAAVDAGLSVSDDELQEAADTFRRTNGLAGAEDTMAWLKAAGLTIEAFQEWIETNVLMEKFRDKLYAETDKEPLAAAAPVKTLMRKLIYDAWLAERAAGTLTKLPD